MKTAQIKPFCIFSVDEDRTKVGIAFRLVNADGTLGEDVYYAHNDLQVGRIYKALFVVDGDENYVSNLTVEAYEATIVENKGTTDDEGKPYKTANAIGAYLGQYDYTLVTEYTQLGNTILDSTKTVGDELILMEVYGATTELVIDTETLSDKVVINWATGDILVKNDAGQYDTVWHWSDRFGYYFRVVGNQTINGTIGNPSNNTNVGIEVMDENDMAALLALLVETSIKEGDTVASFQVADYYDQYGNHKDAFGFYGSYELKEDSGYSPYAYLEAYDLDDDGKAEYAIFEEYRLGYMSNETVYCADCKADVAAIKLAAITAPYTAGYMYNGNATYSPAYIYQSTPCVHTPRVECAQFVEGYEPIMNANGRAVEGYVIYGVDRASNDIKIVKQITKQGDKNQVDADSYIATGRVLGYSIYNQTINIDGKDVTTSSPLHSSAFPAHWQGMANIAYIKDFTTYLSTLYNQYITYVVVDGAIVYAEPCGAEDKEWIVVEGYRGLNRDGKVVMYGYSTENVVLDEYQIEVVNGKWGGNWMWNLEALAELLTKGALLQITSYDAENDLYYVDTNEVITTEGNVTITEADGLFRVTNYTNDGEATKKTQRMSVNDKYIIIGKETAEGFKPVYVHEGLLGDGWSVTGDVVSGYKSITSGTPSAVTVVLTNATITTGFDGETSGISYIWVMDGFYRVPEANYDRGDYAGYSEYVVAGYDLLYPNNAATATCSNFLPEEGKIYKTVDGVILEDDGMTWEEFVADLKIYAGTNDLNSSKYLILEGLEITSDCVPADYNNGTAVSNALKGLSAVIGKEVYNYTADAVDLLNGANYATLTLAADGDLAVMNPLVWDSLWQSIEVTAIYNLETGIVTIYNTGSSITFKAVEPMTADWKVRLPGLDNAWMNLTIDYTVEQTGTMKTVKASKVTVSYEGVTYNNIMTDGYVYTFWNTNLNAALGGNFETIVSVNGQPVSGTLENGYTEDGFDTYRKSFSFDVDYEVTIDMGNAFGYDLEVFTITFTPQNGVAHQLECYILLNGGTQVASTVSCGFCGTGNPLNSGFTSAQTTIGGAAVTLFQ